MTRTYVVGEPPEEIVEYHRLVKEALDRSLAATRAGIPAAEPFRVVCDLFQEAGYPTQLSKAPGEVLTTASSTGSATASASRFTNRRGSAGRRATSSPATSSRWSPGSTARASAACASRISCW